MTEKLVCYVYYVVRDRKLVQVIRDMLEDGDCLEELLEEEITEGRPLTEFPKPHLMVLRADIEDRLMSYHRDTVDWRSLHVLTGYTGEAYAEMMLYHRDGGRKGTETYRRLYYAVCEESQDFYLQDVRTISTAEAFLNVLENITGLPIRGSTDRWLSDLVESALEKELIECDLYQCKVRLS